MKVRFSPIVQHVDGHFGGYSFYHLADQHIVRGHSITHQEPSAAQLAVRSAYGSLYELYTNLDVATALLWNDYADSLEITAFSAWLKANLSGEIAGDPFLFGPPTLGLPCPDLISVVPAGAPGWMRLTWADNSLDNNWKLAFATRPDGSNYFTFTVYSSVLASLKTVIINAGIASTLFQVSIFFYNASTGEFTSSSSLKGLST